MSSSVAIISWGYFGYFGYYNDGVDQPLAAWALFLKDATACAPFRRLFSRHFYAIRTSKLTEHARCRSL
jgi:hypothetical protein